MHTHTQSKQVYIFLHITFFFFFFWFKQEQLVLTNGSPDARTFQQHKRTRFTTGGSDREAEERKELGGVALSLDLRRGKDELTMVMASLHGW